MASLWTLQSYPFSIQVSYFFPLLLHSIDFSHFFFFNFMFCLYCSHRFGFQSAGFIQNFSNLGENLITLIVIWSGIDRQSIHVFNWEPLVVLEVLKTRNCRNMRWSRFTRNPDTQLRNCKEWFLLPLPLFFLVMGFFLAYYCCKALRLFWFVRSSLFVADEKTSWK